MKIAVIFPSRGMAFSQTCEELLENLEGYDYNIFFSHGLPIPDCFNKPLEKALKGSYQYVLFIEEDMILPKGIIRELIAACDPVAAADYPIKHDGTSAALYDPDGNGVYTGMGCLLAKAVFLKKLPKPIFRTDVSWELTFTSQGLTVEKNQTKGEQYGLQDINFGMECYKRGKPIRVIKTYAGQRKLKALGQSGTNHGEHVIETWTELNKSIPKKPKATKLTAVVLNSGDAVDVAPETAERLVKNKLAVLVPRSYVNF